MLKIKTNIFDNPTSQNFLYSYKKKKKFHYQHCITWENHLGLDNDFQQDSVGMMAWFYQSGTTLGGNARVIPLDSNMCDPTDILYMLKLPIMTNGCADIVQECPHLDIGVRLDISCIRCRVIGSVLQADT